MSLTQKQKRHALKQARKSVAFKLKAESPFRSELRSYFYKQSKRIALGLDIESIAPILDHQYKRIVRNMTKIKLKEELEDEYNLEEKIALLLLGRATAQSLRIDKTSEKRLRRSIELARAELSDDGILFPAASTLNRVAANIFRGFTPGRVSNISVTETQMLTEKLKSTVFSTAEDMMEDAIANSDIALAERAAEISGSLTYEEISSDIGSIPAGELFLVSRAVQKAWVTMGDSKVRAAHNMANFQMVPIDEPFTVMGELLMYPGDTSMGASMENIAGCRCSDVIM